MRVFITGGTGLLGHTLMRQLSEQGHQLLALVRNRPEPSVFSGIQPEFLEGSLSDRKKITEAIGSCDAVIHTAALIHLGWKRLQESLEVNRDGTRTIVDACCRHQVPMVHVGTVNTLAVGTRSEVVNEETPADHAGGQVECSYVVSKRAGVSEVIAGAARKLKCAIVHPGLMFGPWDWKPSSGRMVLAVTEKWRPIAPSGGTSVCDSRDVASATIAAMDLISKGQIPSGRQYILAGENWTYYELWKQLAKRAAQHGPIMPAGPAQRWIAQMFGDMVSVFSSKESDLNSAAVKMSTQYHWYDSSRAKSELGYKSRGPDESIEDSIQWLRRCGYLK